MQDPGCPYSSVYLRLCKECIVHLAVGLLRNNVLDREKKIICLIVCKYVDIQNIRCLAIGNTGIHYSVNIVPGNNFYVQIDVWIGFVKFCNEVSPPISCLLAILCSDHVNIYFVCG